MPIDIQKPIKKIHLVINLKTIWHMAGRSDGMCLIQLILHLLLHNVGLN